MGLQAKLRDHLRLAQLFANELRKMGNYEILAPIPFNLVCFRHTPPSMTDTDLLNAHNAALLSGINQSGKAYLSHTKLNGQYALRAVFGQTNVAEKHVWQLIQLIADSLRAMK